MKSQRKGLLRRSSEMLRVRDEGGVEWAAGLFFTLFLAVIMYTQLQILAWQETSSWLEDTLAASNLAAALIDIEEYGISHTVLIPDAEAAYDVYVDAVHENLALDDHWMSTNRALISGQVGIDDFIIYNVKDGAVTAIRVDENGRIISEWNGTAGVLSAPNGVLVEETGVYSEISFEVVSFPGITTRAHKGKLVNVVSELE